jgi:hypothetical protein
MVTRCPALNMFRQGIIPITMFTLTAGLLSGCAHQKPPLYHWGEYENLVYDMYVNPGKADPGTQIVELSEDIQQASALGQRVPPGVHAHLGYMYYIQGNPDEARHEFLIERELFPESKVFIDGMLQRLQNE